MKKDLIPTRYSNFINLEKNFVEKFRGLAQKLDIKENEMEKTIEILKNHINSFDEMKSKRAESKAATEDHILKNKKAVKEFRRMAKLISASRTYTQGIGFSLGIISTRATEKNPEDFKPVLTMYVSGDKVHIKFIKQRKDGIAVYSRRGDEKLFSFVQNCARSPFVDFREKLEHRKPEAREYYAIYLKNFKETGQPSNVAKIVVP